MVNVHTEHGTKSSTSRSNGLCLSNRSSDVEAVVVTAPDDNDVHVRLLDSNSSSEGEDNVVDMNNLDQRFDQKKCR